MVFKVAKEKKGITLIALVITIIVLLILAGVSIATLTGENGILTRAQEAKEENEKAEIIEQIRLDISDIQIENQGSINEDEFYGILGKYGTVSEDKTILKTTSGNYDILISDIYSEKITSSLVTTPIESWDYTISGTNVILNRYIGTDAKINIPSTFNIDGIIYNTKIRNTWEETRIFNSNSIIEEVKFEDGVESTDNYAYGWFMACPNLTTVYNMPSNITGWSVTFQNCQNLINAPNIPEGVTDISGAFQQCVSLKKAPLIPSTVTNMNSTFSNCLLLEGVIEILAENITEMNNTFAFPNNNKLNYITLKVEENTTTYQTILSQIDNWSNVNLYGETISTISCWGDSLTTGAGGNGTTYVSVLDLLNGRKVNTFNLGVGGENTSTIAGRQGGIPYVVSKFTIPADTSKVEIEIAAKDGSNVAPLLQDATGIRGINNCFINGIEGKITYEDQKYYFSRVTSGKSVNVEDGTEIITSGMNNYRDSDIIIIWTGQNDVATASNISDIIEKQKKMIEYANTENYLVISLLYAGDEVNNVMSETYGEHFLDIRNALSTDNSNTVSSEYKSDSVHLNADGYTIVGEQVYNKLLSLGYLTE